MTTQTVDVRIFGKTSRLGTTRVRVREAHGSADIARAVQRVLSTRLNVLVRHDSQAVDGRNLYEFALVSATGRVLGHGSAALHPPTELKG
jgi:hypothetical protein